MTEFTNPEDELFDDLRQLQQEFNESETLYDDPDPPIIRRAADWAALTRLEPDFQPFSAHTTFAEAWHNSVVSIHQLFAWRFPTLAARIIQRFGRQHFPDDPGLPPFLEPWEAQRRPQNFMRLLTRCDVALDAGLRIIDWAASAHFELRSGRSFTYQPAIDSWVPNLIEIGFGRCRPHQEPLTWVWQAAVHLASCVNGSEESRELSPQRLAHMFGIHRDTMVKRLKDQVIRNRKITTKSYRVHLDDLPAGYRNSALVVSPPSTQ